MRVTECHNGAQVRGGGKRRRSPCLRLFSAFGTLRTALIVTVSVCSFDLLGVGCELGCEHDELTRHGGQLTSRHECQMPDMIPPPAPAAAVPAEQPACSVGARALSFPFLRTWRRPLHLLPRKRPRPTPRTCILRVHFILLPRAGIFICGSLGTHLSLLYTHRFSNIALSPSRADGQVHWLQDLDHHQGRQGAGRSMSETPRIPTLLLSLVASDFVLPPRLVLL